MPNVYHRLHFCSEKNSKTIKIEVIFLINFAFVHLRLFKWIFLLMLLKEWDGSRQILAKDRLKNELLC